MNRPNILSLLPLVLALFAGAAAAEKADKAKPMNVEADTLRYDDLKQTSVFTGKVVLTKGTILIRGSRVDVRQDAEGFQYGVVTAEAGKLAFYRQKREGVDEFIEGEGETIEYDGKADRVKFIKRAEMRRFRGAALADDIVGSVITYDNTNDVFNVDGGPPGTVGGPLGGSRVRAVLAPRNGASAPAGASSSSQPALQLRPSMTFDGGKK